jgi:hypothetical protein
MAVGDDATAAGFSLVAGTDDRRNGWTEINRSRDYTAQTKTWATTQLAGKAATSHTHSASAITSGTLAAARLPSTLEANGPSDAAYSRSATGSNWYATWMNDNNQFMRNSSSLKYKTDVVGIGSAGCLDIVMALRPVFYSAIAEPENNRHVGLIAEEVYEVLPEVVPLWDGQPEAVNYEFLVAPLIGAVQALKAQNDALQARIEALEASHN